MGTMGRGSAATAARELESTRSGCDVPNVWAGQRRVFLSPSVEFAPRVRPWETSVEPCQRDPTVVLGSFDALHGSGENSSSCTPSSQEGVQEPRYLCAKSPRPGTMRTYAGAPAGNDSPQGKRALRSPVVPPAQKLTAIPRASAFADASSSQGSSTSTSSLLSRVYRSQCVHGEPDPDMVASRCVEGSARGGKRRRVCNASSMLCRQSALASDSTKVAVSLGVCLSDRLDPAGRRSQHKWDHEPLDALRTRETGCLRGSALRCATLALRFRSMRLRQEYDANANNMSFKLPLLRRRASVVEIVAVDDVVFTLTANGICTAFKATTQKRLCCLNLSADEVVRSIFLNKANHALITVSVRHEDRFLRLRCRSTPIEAICRGRPECGFPLFTSECLSWPGFVEFDDVNSKVLTFSANDRSYTVWDLATYRRLYRIACRSIAEIKISPGMMLLIHQRVGSHVPLQFVEMETGVVRRELFYLLNRSRKIEFIELFHDKLLVKQEGTNLRIVDLRTNEEREVPSSQHMTPNHFIFLYETKLFLLFRDQKVQVWDFLARRVVPRLTNHALRVSATPTNTLYISTAQDILVSYRASPVLNDEDDCTEDARLGRPSTCSSPHTNCPLSSSWNALSSSSSSSSSSDVWEGQGAPDQCHGSRRGSNLVHRAQDVRADGGDRETSQANGDDCQHERYDAHSGSIWISHIPTGACLGRIRARLDSLDERRALSDVTAIYYHEDRNEIYTASRSGLVHRWSV